VLQEHSDPPDITDETKLFILPVDPHRIFAYWTVMISDMEKILNRPRRKYGELSAIARFYDITGIEFNGNNAVCSFDLDVDLPAGKCYVPVRNSGRKYIADLGFINEYGIFYPLCRSNTTETPCDIVPDTSPETHASSAHRQDLSGLIDRGFMPGISSGADSRQ